jgi:hypothetical protein
MGVIDVKPRLVRLAAAIVAMTLAAGCSSAATPRAASSSPSKSPPASPAPTLSDYLSTRLPSDLTAHVKSASASDEGATISTDLYLGSISSMRICRTALGFTTVSHSALPAASSSASPAASSSAFPTASPDFSFVAISVYGHGGKLLSMSDGTHCGLNLPIRAATALASLCGTLNSLARLERQFGHLAHAGNIAGAVALAHQLLALSGPISKDAEVFARSGLTPSAADAQAMAAGNTQAWQGVLGKSLQRFKAGLHTYMHGLHALWRDGPPCQ